LSTWSFVNQILLQTNKGLNYLPLYFTEGRISSGYF